MDTPIKILVVEDEMLIGAKIQHAVMKMFDGKSAEEMMKEMDMKDNKNKKTSKGN